MIVNLLRSNYPDAALTEPWPQPRGLCWRVLAGDYLDPMFGDWYNPDSPPRLVLRGRLRRALFVSWRFGRWRGYAGLKVYGVDSPAYREWAPCNHIYPQTRVPNLDGSTLTLPGSQAMCFSLRPFSTIPKQEV